MATHPFMHRQQELIQQLNDLINSYERDLAEVKTKLAREKEAAEEQRKRKLAEILQAIIKVRSVKDSTVAILRRRGMDERKLQEKNSKIFEEYIDSEPEEMAAYQAMAEDASKALDVERVPSLEMLITVILLFGGSALSLIVVSFNFISPFIIGSIILSILFMLAFVAGAIYYHRVQMVRMEDDYADFIYAVNSAESLYQTLCKSAEADYQQQITSEVVKSHQIRLQQIEETMTSGLADFKAKIDAYIREIGIVGADWHNPVWRQWQPSTGSPVPITRLGALTIKYQQVELPPLPIFVPFPGNRNLLLQASGTGLNEAMAVTQSLLLRLLATNLPGTIQFTFIDPITFGQSIAPFMQLANYDEALVGGRIWTEASHIEQQLSALSEYIALVNQKYLWEPTTTIENYNKKNRNNPLPYRLLVVFGFPYKFTLATAHSLLSIARNGPRCGVCIALVRDVEQPLMPGFNIRDLERMSTVITWQGQQIVWDEVNLQKQDQIAFVA